MQQLSGLITDSLGNYRICMPQCNDAEAGEPIEIPIALVVHEPGTLAVGKRHVESTISRHYRVIHGIALEPDCKNGR